LIIKSITEMTMEELLIDIEHFRKVRIEIRQRQIATKRADDNGDKKKMIIKAKVKNDIEMDDILKDFLT